ncbi:hypothetical protein [Sinanaerobacter chloroacetimidivorans]|jgi:hypothetical protein|uniref:Uncharacterized protein n=1 Tax=Sinanaerobacter chloroacetimidivorans TaxID=2818044 RepID=A0A8J8B0A9_9FIRM|nr:hypothetical protein [Sinanaerobacter chloroacetimidivorans]MBR0597398.1 hypothetical protein [Sinanaerobacter chloroacetimidivorans]
MLSKLIKYDIKSTWRDFSGVYMAILLGVIIVPLMLNNMSNQFISMAAGFLAFGIVIAVIVVMIVNLFKIFNTNVFSREGYLTLTLPVTSAQIVFSKLIVSSMWIVLTGLVSMIGIFIFALVLNPVSYIEIGDGLRKLFSLINGKTSFTMILIIMSVILSSVKEVAKLFLACSIAHLKQLNRFRIPAGILSYFIFSWAETLVVQSFTLIASLLPNAGEWINKFNAISDPGSFMQMQGLFNGVIGVGILYALLLIAGYSMGTVWILNHKLDLD